MGLKLGPNPLNVFGPEFEDAAYCWLLKDTEGAKDLWLSLIMVKEKHKRNGMLHKLLEDAKKDMHAVIIPTPSTVVIKTAKKHGYEMMDVVDKQVGKIACMVWKRK
jgi:hypothetical protein